MRNKIEKRTTAVESHNLITLAIMVCAAIGCLGSKAYNNPFVIYSRAE